MKISPRKNQRGFSTFELIIVLAIICALSFVIYITYNSFRQKERDTTRKQDLTLLQRKLESYQAQNGNYPTLKDMNNTLWRENNLKNFDVSIFQDPQGASSILVASPVSKAYAYSPSPAGCNNGENGGKPLMCTAYTLTATLEGGGTYSLKNFY